MRAKKKLIISMLVVSFVLLSIIATVAITFALTQQTIKTTLNIGYTVEDIDGSVYATYTLGGETSYLEPQADADHISEDGNSLLFKATDTENAGNLIFPNEALNLTKDVWDLYIYNRQTLLREITDGLNEWREIVVGKCSYFQAINLPPIYL